MFLETPRAKFQCLAIISLSILTGFAIYKAFGVAQPAEPWMCNQNGYAIQIIDDSVTPKVKSIESVNDRYYRSFIGSLTHYISSRSPQAGSCTGNSDRGSMSSLTFVRLPLVTSGNNPLPAPPKLSLSLSGITCRLDSPWVKLAIRNSDNPVVQGIFIWNERQFLADQALLANPKLNLNSHLLPLSNRSFERYATDYADSEILRAPSGKDNITDRIPLDVLWLFRNSPQTTFIPFSDTTRSAMNTTVKRLAEGYTYLAQKLFDQCFASTRKVDQHYESIIDLRNTISLEKFRIH